MENAKSKQICRKQDRVMIVAKIRKDKDIECVQSFLEDGDNPLEDISITSIEKYPQILDICTFCGGSIPAGKEEFMAMDPYHRVCLEKIEQKDLVAVPVDILDAVKHYINQHPSAYANVEEAINSILRTGIHQISTKGE